MENRTTRPKKWATFAIASGARLLFSRPVTIWTVMGRNQSAAAARFVQLWNVDAQPGSGASVLGLDGAESLRVPADADFAVGYARGWRCDRGFAVAVSTTEETFTAAQSGALVRVEYEDASDDDRAIIGGGK